MRQQFEMTQEEYDKMLDIAKNPVPYLLGTGGFEMFESQQERANRAWQEMGEKYGFVWDSCQPVDNNKKQFTAETK